MYTTLYYTGMGVFFKSSWNLHYSKYVIEKKPYFYSANKMTRLYILITDFDRL
jgi:hypothetical protein